MQIMSGGSMAAADAPEPEKRAMFRLAWNLVGRPVPNIEWLDKASELSTRIAEIKNAAKVLNIEVYLEWGAYEATRVNGGEERV